MTPGMKAAVFGSRRTEPGHDAPGWVAANDPGDGVLSDLALRIRYGEIGIRHGAAVEGLGKACRGLNRSLAAWEERRTSEGNAAIAMDPGFRADLRAAGAVLKAARPYMKDDPLHRRLLAERGGIAAADLEDLASRRRRGRSIRDMSIAGRRAADPGFVPAPPARRPEDARIAAVGRALEALEPIETSIEISAAKPKPKPQPAPAETRPATVSAAEAEARYNRFLADARENRRVARSQGLHPYETREAPGLIERARELTRLEALPADRARSLSDDVARYDDWFNSGRPAPKPAPANPGPRQKPPPADTHPATVSASEAVTLHRRFLANAIVNRRAAHSRGLHPYQTEEAPALIEQARALLRLEALPADRARSLRDDVARYDEWLGSGRRAPTPAPGAEQPRQRRPKSRAQAEFDALYDRFLADARANRAAARRQGVHPCMTKDAPRIIRQARELIRLGRLPGAAAETLADTIVEYERMRAAAARARTRSTPNDRQAARPARTGSRQAHRATPSTEPQPSRRPPAPEPRTQSRSTAATPSPAAAPAKPDPARSAETRAAEEARAAEKERAENRERNRARIESFLRRAPEIERRHMELSIAAIGQGGAESAAARRDWLGEARAVRDEGEALERDIPKREIEEHLAARGGAPVDIGITTHAIRTGIGPVEKDLAEHARREAAERAKRDAGRAREEERARAAKAEQAGRREGTAPEGGALPGPDAPQPSDRDRRAAAKLAARLDDCLARRETLLERAETTLHPSRPVADLGRSPRRLAAKGQPRGGRRARAPRQPALRPPPRYPWRQGPDRGRNRPPRKGRPVRQHAGAHRARLGGGRGPGPRDRPPPLLPRRAPHRPDPDVPVAGKHPGRGGAALRQGGVRAARADGRAGGPAQGRGGPAAGVRGGTRSRPGRGPRSWNGRATASGGRGRTRRCKTRHGYWARGRRSRCTSRTAPGWRRSWGSCPRRSASAMGGERAEWERIEAKRAACRGRARAHREAAASGREGGKGAAPGPAHKHGPRLLDVTGSGRPGSGAICATPGDAVSVGSLRPRSAARPGSPALARVVDEDDGGLAAAPRVAREAGDGVVDEGDRPGLAPGPAVPDPRADRQATADATLGERPGAARTRFAREELYDIMLPYANAGTAPIPGVRGRMRGVRTATVLRGQGAGDFVPRPVVVRRFPRGIGIRPGDRLPATGPRWWLCTTPPGVRTGTTTPTG